MPLEPKQPLTTELAADKEDEALRLDVLFLLDQELFFML